METTARETDVLIVGAGMCGLTAARQLREADLKVIVLDKARGVGGRMASRRIGNATFDHGAQFFTDRDPTFSRMINSWKEAGVAELWSHGFSPKSDGHPRWRGNPGMTSIAKHLAQNQEIFLQQKLTALRPGSECWSAETESGEIFLAKSVVLTPPVPQSLDLLRTSDVELEPATASWLGSLDYECCLAVLAILERPSLVPPPGGLALDEGPITWLADNQKKGISLEPAVTIHAGPDFSSKNWNQDRNEAAQLLINAARDWIGCRVLNFQIHGWRYSKPKRVTDHRCFVVSQSPKLVLAGDAFGGPRVEGAALSGLAAAEAIMAELKTL